MGKGERYVHLKNPLPVHLTYFTLSVDEKGALLSFDDLYGFDRKVRAALGLSSEDADGADPGPNPTRKISAFDRHLTGK